MNLTAIKVIGGTSLYNDVKALRRNPDVIVGTPGRIKDLIERGELPMEAFSALILDEFDRMLDMGFSRDVMLIADAMNNREQTLLFSATVDGSTQQYVDRLVKNPVIVKVTTGLTTAENVDQDVVYPVNGEDRFDTLVRMLQDHSFERVILFAETRHKVHRLAGRLNKVNIAAEAIHGDKTQAARQQALNKFKSGHSRILVATDVAARGIDVNDVSHVINYEVPRTYDSYIHRIGRTGRAGKTGIALTFVD
jgi:ATP-dependent RNA helicase RhlE